MGLPNVGKSTLFNAVTQTRKAMAANYRFCTIEPNTGVVTVPDERLEVLAKMSNSQKIVPAVFEFVDIAGSGAEARAKARVLAISFWLISARWTRSFRSCAVLKTPTSNM